MVSNSDVKTLHAVAMSYKLQSCYFFDVKLIVFYLLFHSAGCGDPTPPVNGSIVGFVSAVVGSQVLYSCDPGFLPEGLRTSICSSNMNWSPNPAEFPCRNPSELYTYSYGYHTNTGTVSNPSYISCT